MFRIVVIQHVEGEGLGIIEKVVRQKGIEVITVRVFKGERIPREVQDYSGLIILGGPMGVYEDDLYPFIKEELTLIRNAIRCGIAVLGICLGSQLLAKAVGGDVYKGKKKEIGWYKIRLTDEGKKDGLFIGLPDEFTVFQWHGDTFDIPEGSICLASSETFPHQIIKVGKMAYGLQFHLEVTEGMIRDWVNVNDRELTSLGYINPEGILKDTPWHIQTIHRYGEVVFSRFFELLNR